MDNEKVEQPTQQEQPTQKVEQEEKLLTFTQAQMSALMSREKHEGKDSVYRSLGIDPRDKKAVNELKTKLAQSLQEEQAPQPVSDKQENKQQEQQHKGQGNTSAIKAEAKVTLLGEGVQPELLEDAMTLLLHKVENQDQIPNEVAALKAKHGILFTSQKQTTGQLVGGVGAGATQQQQTAADFGKKLAQAKNANKTTQTQFFRGGR